MIHGCRYLSRCSPRATAANFAVWLGSPCCTAPIVSDRARASKGSDLGFDDVANGVAITSGGTILVAGTRLGLHTNLDPFVASYGPNGKLNPGFGDFGVADTDLSGGDDSGDDIVLDPNGGIVVVGTASSSTVSDMAIVRYRLDGSLDTFLTTDFHGAGDFGHALAVDPLGGIVAAGTIANGSENEFGLVHVFF